jgi:hypothetical protein
MGIYHNGLNTNSLICAHDGKLIAADFRFCVTAGYCQTEQPATLSGGRITAAGQNLQSFCQRLRKVELELLLKVFQANTTVNKAKPFSDKEKAKFSALQSGHVFAKLLDALANDSAMRNGDRASRTAEALCQSMEIVFQADGESDLPKSMMTEADLGRVSGPTLKRILKRVFFKHRFLVLFRLFLVRSNGGVRITQPNPALADDLSALLLEWTNAKLEQGTDNTAKLEHASLSLAIVEAMLLFNIWATQEQTSWKSQKYSRLEETIRITISNRKQIFEIIQTVHRLLSDLAVVPGWLAKRFAQQSELVTLFAANSENQS